MSACKPTYSQAKKRAWDAFSKFIRLRDIDKPCITCPVHYSWKEMQAGYFLPGRHNSVLFEEKNCHKQCQQCNVFKKGNLIEYYPKMLELYGQRTIDRLKKENRAILKLKVWQLLGIEKTYIKKFQKLLVTREGKLF